jgi:hypothetical protein
MTDPQARHREAAKEIYDDMANPDSPGMSIEQMAAIIAKHEGEELESLRRALSRIKTTFFYIRNLSHDAWRDPKNLPEVCKRIEDYARMEYDLIDAALSSVPAAPQPEKEKVKP